MYHMKCVFYCQYIFGGMFDVPPILKYNSNAISEKTLAETRVFKFDKSGILSAQIPGSCVLNVAIILRKTLI